MLKDSLNTKNCISTVNNLNIILLQKEIIFMSGACESGVNIHKNM